MVCRLVQCCLLLLVGNGLSVQSEPQLSEVSDVDFAATQIVSAGVMYDARATIERLQSELQDVQAQLGDAQGDICTLEETISTLEGTISTMKETIATLEETSARLMIQGADMEAEISNKDKQIRALEQRLALANKATADAEQRSRLPAARFDGAEVAGVAAGALPVESGGMGRLSLR